ncbi:hypothetical protein AURDEDRAFT_162240 [Auricularia subglabra TFB-10046 SS5]|nr:hypothetical protein AURDEDRAFT_162240 [Auricularia subglabra TFB-10046 SS5]
MPALADSVGIARLRKALKERFSPPRGDYLVIPTDGEPYPVAATEAFAIFAGPPRIGDKGNVLHDPIRSHCIYHDELLERFMGNPHSWPEGHFFRLYEAIMNQQSGPMIAVRGLRPNPRATALLHWHEEIFGPVLVQMSYLLKRRETRKSVVAVRKPLALDFLKGAEWRRMRMEYRALIRAYAMDGVEIRQDQLEMRTASAVRYHIHADP